MITLLLALMLAYLLYRTGTIGGRVQLALVFIGALAVVPFLLRLVILQFGQIGFWSMFVAIGLLALFVSYRRTARNYDA